MTYDRRANRRPESQLVDIGADVGQAIVGTAAAVATSNPATAVAAVGVVAFVSRLSQDFLNRRLSEMQRGRVDSVIKQVEVVIRQKMDEGYTVRSDDFLSGQPGHRSLAEELSEGVLIAVEDEHEELKLPFFANLLANFVFRPDINGPIANFLVELTRQLSYRQLTLLQAAIIGEGYPVLWNSWPYPAATYEPNMRFLHAEIRGLFTLGLIEFHHLSSDDSQIEFYGTGCSRIDLTRQFGELLCDLMEIRNLNGRELDETLGSLRYRDPALA
jgi:hypothetical protein